MADRDKVEELLTDIFLALAVDSINHEDERNALRALIRDKARKVVAERKG